MFFDGKHAVDRVKDGIYRRRKLIILCGVWCTLIICLSLKNEVDRLSFQPFQICQSDLLISLQYSGYFELCMFPFIIFVIMRCKMDSLNMQYLIRYKKRKQVLYRQAAESFLYALGASMFIVGVEMILASAQKLSFINWELEESCYYAKTGMVLTEKYWIVAIGVCLMYVVKFLIILSVLDVLMWYPKEMFLLWILIVFLGEIEAYTVNGKVFHGLFAVRYETWQPVWNFGIWIFIGILIVILEYQVGVFITRKKDIYR